jgi:hypothetical protein
MQNMQMRSSGNQLGLFDLTSNGNSTNVPTNNSQAAAEVGRLKDELIQNRARLASWEDGMQQARSACEAWKKEAAIASKKADLAIKEKDAAMLKLIQMKEEMDSLNGGPHLHAVRRVQDLKTTPVGVLKTLEWQLRKDLQEVEKVQIIKIIIRTLINDFYKLNRS